MKRKRRALRRALGGALVVSGCLALAGSGAFWLSGRAEERYAADFALTAARSFARQSSAGEYSRLPVPSQTPPSGSPPPPPGLPVEDVVVVGESAYIGVLAIEKLGIELPVAASWSYEALKRTPCRYSGTADGGSLVIAAHNYKSHFYGITRLARGDAVTLLLPDGSARVYAVESAENVKPSAIEHITQSDHALTLLTCTY
ncbi:MAG: sortase, partial [Oscillospiraceae bacterium]|nr:sortase [Oscillospiraceae bacterium]